MQRFIDRIKGFEKYYIYGTSSLARFCFEQIVGGYGENAVSGFIETIPSVPSLCGKGVISPDELGQERGAIGYIIAAGNDASAEQMRNTLIRRGILESAIIEPKEYRFLFKFRIEKPIRKICLWPPIEKVNSNLFEKIKWFVPDRIDVAICGDKDVLTELILQTKNVRLYDADKWELEWGEADYVYVWDVESAFDDIRQCCDKVRVIDPYFSYYVETSNISKIYFESFSESDKEEFERHSAEVFSEMKEQYGGSERANVFCSGPSVEEVFNNDYRADFNIICNSTVKDDVFLDHIYPNLIVFTDNNYYLSPNDYCLAFYRDLRKAYKKYGCYIMLFDYQLPLFRYHFPDLYEKTMGVHALPRKEKFCFPSKDNMTIRGTGTITSQLMVPVASSLADTICIAGCTGRNQDENYFWRHNGRLQYHDLLHFVFEEYPSVFAGRKYEDDYEEHCQDMKDVIEYGESLGKKYISLTSSFIPALAERMERQEDSCGQVYSD